MNRSRHTPPAGAAPSSLWSNRDFLKLWAAHTAETFGSLMGALSFTAALILDATPRQMALLAAAGTAPGLAAGLPAGLWVDRLPRRQVLIVADVGRAIAMGSIPVAYAFGAMHIAHLYAVAFATGLLDVFFDAAHPSFVPFVVRRDQLVAANSRMSGTASAVEIGAFGVSGWIAQLASAIASVVVNAAAFLASGALLFFMRVREPRGGGATATGPLRAELVEGLRFLWGQPALRALSAAHVLRGLSGGIIGGLILVFGIRELGFAPGVLGMIFAVGGISSLGGAFIAPALTRRFGIGPVIAATGAIIGFAILLIPLARGPLVIAGAFLVGQQLLGDWAWAVYDINELSLRQALTPDKVRGRVNSGVRWLGVVAALGGSLLAGAIVGWAGMRWTLAIAGVATLSAAALLAVSPVRRLKETPGEGVA
ncbi:MAG: MFS transporter [Chloroflexi bacterium]|nr:MFS transporter [Chloroflexota bacterium]